MFVPGAAAFIRSKSIILAFVRWTELIGNTGFSLTGSAEYENFTPDNGSRSGFLKVVQFKYISDYEYFSM